MGSSNNKRQHARNERILHDLVRNVAGNSSCADCGAANPSWASWNLGIFLCMRCASLHRKLGTHISKVKSLTMDQWTNEQVEHMRQTGNAVSNQKYNPSNRRPPVPIDADETDSAQERFIRQKYMTAELATSNRQDAGSAESDEATPPPPPPKHGLLSSFLGASFGSKSRKSPRRTKASQVLGAGFSTDTGPAGGELEAKLTKLRDMGFVDDQRNQIVLKGMGGNLEKTIESLVRLGGDQSPASATTPVGATFQSPEEGKSRSLTSAASMSALDGGSGGPGTSRGKDAKGASFVPRPASGGSTNPFDLLDKPQPPLPLPLSTQSTGTLPTRNPYLASTNPFGMPAAQTSTALDQAFQNLSLTAPQQPLFPHHTGGLVTSPAERGYQQQQHLTGPAAAASQNYAAVAYNGIQTYPQPVQRALVPQVIGHNPFLTANSQAQLQQQQNQHQLSVNTNVTGAHAVGGGVGNNPFARSPVRINSPPMLTQIPEQSQPSFFAGVAAQQQQQQQQQQQYPQQQQQFPQQQPQQFQQLQPQHTSSNPFLTQTMTNPFAQPLAQQQFQYQMAGQQPDQTMQAAPQRADKASILALYNFPQLAPQTEVLQATRLDSQAMSAGVQQAQQLQAQQSPNPFSASKTFPLSFQQQQQPQQQAQQQAVVSGTPLAGSTNPFMVQMTGQLGAVTRSDGTGGMTVAAPTPTPAAASSLVDVAAKHNHSRDSVMAMGLDWTNGRHSPDAFASLSARDMR